MEITSVQALTIMQRAIAKATEIAMPVNIVIMDTSGYIKLFQRMDNAYLAAIDIAIKKAKTAMLFRANTETVGETYFAPEARAYGMIDTNGGLIGFQGGMPVRDGDTIVAYIGISGGSPAQDFEIASAANTL
ncbi:GlcG/HbpS family heme-binding protein [Mucilaginibacter celer]|uniref:Heme-binding protein n=1 Tax=Mucilaginibacter celer TaxID=2305508 RepID=A0A494VQN4_9SPHI|nr:heme-binding protein [Mucilaginibacter celer]AYL96709.1 heme-binding protein [Mucilaginibacter celer]